MSPPDSLHDAEPPLQASALRAEALRKIAAARAANAETEAGRPFALHADFRPAGDQPQAIDALVEGFRNGRRDQVLLGVTGSGKTFSMANVIAALQRPALALAPNKTLAAQLYNEFRHFFPDNAVEYFVSYYDYYQPEAYVPRSDTYIEKESDINRQIDRMRHAATRSLFERKDVIIVASVSCIYGIGTVESYTSMTQTVAKGQTLERRDLLAALTAMQYKRNDAVLERGSFRARGDVVEIFPAHLEDRAWRVSLFGDEVEGIEEFDALTGRRCADRETVRIYAGSHYVTPGPTLRQALETIAEELEIRLEELHREHRLLEAQRLKQRTLFDMEMIEATGSCAGIENYSRHLTGRPAGAPPPTLFEYLPEDTLIFVDESHVAIPQLRGMYNGDLRRKTTLSEFGFRLPSCCDNRPLKFEEWNAMRPQTLYISATPGPWELERVGGEIVEQLIRPTGLLDPPVSVRPARSQVDDFLEAAGAVVAAGRRVLATTLTKKTAEDLTDYLNEQGFAVRYLHSDIETLERSEILRDLRLGVFDVLIGINLLREGLDIPECGLVAVLDADKEGFLRSETSLVQTIGRAARNRDGYVILYGDRVTGSMARAIDESQRRRDKQLAHNEAHGIVPTSTGSRIADLMHDPEEDAKRKQRSGKASHRAAMAMAEEQRPYKIGDHPQRRLADLRKRMLQAAEDLEFERAALLRDDIRRLQAQQLEIDEAF